MSDVNAPLVALVGFNWLSSQNFRSSTVRPVLLMASRWLMHFKVDMTENTDEPHSMNCCYNMPKLSSLLWNRVLASL